MFLSRVEKPIVREMPKYDQYMLRTVIPESTKRKSTRRWFAFLFMLLGTVLLVGSIGAFAFDWFSVRPVDVNPVSNGVWHKPIEEISPGERVFGENPIEAPDTAFGKVDPATWKQLTLRAPKQDGDYCDIVMLRPGWWLEEKGAALGESIQIDVEELGIHDAVDVLAIDDCPSIPAGSGHVVTATFHHSAGAVYQLQIEGDEPIGVTGNHPFYSADRHEFVPAAELRIGENIHTFAGPKRVLSRTPLPGQHLVYNLEVHGQHVYHVGLSGALVHNAYGANNDEAVDVYRIVEKNELDDIVARGNRYHSPPGQTILPAPDAKPGKWFYTSEADALDTAAEWSKQSGGTKFTVTKTQVPKSALADYPFKSIDPTPTMPSGKDAFFVDMSHLNNAPVKILK